MKELGRRVAATATKISFVRTAARAGARRGLVPAAVWRRLPPGVGEITVELSSGRFFRYLVDPGDPFTRQLAWRGMDGPEGASLVAFAELARSARTVVDVGAHTGLYTLAALASSHTVRCTSFEPVDRNREFLVENLRLNGFTDRCDVRAEAVADSCGEIEFHVPGGDHPMSGSLDPQGFRGLSGEVRHVRVTTIDAAVEGSTTDLVKIDVEGFEDRVVEGMVQHLSLSKPTLVIECNPDGPYDRVSRLLRQHGYGFRLLDGREGPLTSVIRPDPTERFRNVLCVPPT